MVGGRRGTHRVALELEVDEDRDSAEPEDWDLPHLSRALRAGVAKPVRTIRGLVIDSEHDRLSGTLDAVAEDLVETVELQWLASSKPWPAIAGALQVRPSLEVLVELEELAAATRRIARRLQAEGL